MNFQVMEKGSAPLIAFEQRAEEDRTATIETGRLVSKDVDYVIIRTPGSKDTVEKVATEWLEQCERDCRSIPPRYPKEWAAGHRENYRRWKEGLEIVPEGFPMRNWAGASAAQVANCARANILTVEALAMANDDALGMIGMGGRSLKDRAKAWLDSSKGNVGEELNALRSKVAELEEQLKTEREKRAEVEAALRAYEPSKKRA